MSQKPYSSVVAAVELQKIFVRGHADHQTAAVSSMELDTDPETHGIGIMISNERIARVYIKLDHIKLVIWRRVVVPITTSLKGLHDVIQAVMLFGDYHLFGFNAGGRRYAASDPEWDLGRETYAARNVRIGALVERGIETLDYIYDFGDDWRHSITVEAATDADPAVEYPTLRRR